MKNSEKPNVLIVDDSSANLIYFNEILSSHIDANIIEANSGKEAIKKASTEKLALIISDVQMPGMDGFEMLTQIYAKNSQIKTPCIFVSAIYTDEANILKGINTGAIDFISKPFNDKILVGKVNHFLEYYKTNQEIIEKNEIIEKITNTALEGIFIISQEGIITFWNPAAEKITGYHQNEAIGLNIVNLVFPDNSSLISNLINDYKSLKSNNLGNLLELKAKNKANQLFPIELSVSNFMVEDTGFLIGIFRDITQRKIIEQQNLKAQQQKESNKAMSDFMDNISHELKTPLNSILGILKILKNNESKNLQPQQLESLDIMWQSGKKLDALIHNILEFKNKYTIKLNPATTKSVIDELSEFGDELAQNKNLEFFIEYNINELPEIIITDENKLIFCIHQLIENAIKYTDKGFIKISVTSENSNILFKISDSGIGINKNHYKEIFSAFSQLDASNKKKYNGTGLGLSLVKKEIEALGGSISVDSELNIGTTFTIQLPIREE